MGIFLWNYKIFLCMYFQVNLHTIFICLLLLYYYCIIYQVSRIRPTVYTLLMNDSYLSVDVHRMTDGTLLVSINGSSYTTYFKEEVDHYRVVVSGQTGVFEKENDPEVLR